MFSGKRQLVGFGVLLLLGLVALSGCGGGGESSSPLTAAQFKAQANKICSHETQKLEKEIEEYAGKRNLKYREPSKRDFEDEAKEIFIPSVERKVDQLQALEGPAKDEQEVAKIAAAAEKALQEGKSDTSVLVSGQALVEVRKLATEYGLKECF
jgi:hypothetical protein